MSINEDEIIIYIFKAMSWLSMYLRSYSKEKIPLTIIFLSFAGNDQ